MNGTVVAVAQVTEVIGNVDESVRQHVRLAVEAAEQGARLVVFPELSLTGYSRALARKDAIGPDDRRLKPIHSTASIHGITVVAGAPVATFDGLHIGAIVISPDGSGSIYQKEHLHPGEETAFAPGRGGDCVSVSGETVALAICADIVHPEHANAAASRGASIYAAGCFVTERGYSEFEHALQLYASGHRMLVLMANYAAPTKEYDSAGRSAIWSASGDVLGRAEKNGQAVVLAQKDNNGWSGKVFPVA